MQALQRWQHFPPLLLPADIYDEADLVLINDDWYLKRFLLARNRNVDQAFAMLDETMRWRNDMYISQVRDYHFPSEFYAIGALFIYEPDRQGNLVLYMRIRMHHKTAELDEPAKGFLVHNFNKAEKLSQGNGFAIVFDLSGAGYSNLDFPFLTFLINFGRNHFPGSLAYILVYNLPWVLSTFQKMVFAMLPPEASGMIKFASGSEIFKYIAPENTPDYIEGGTCGRNYRKVAPGSKPILDLVMHYGYSQADYDRIYPAFKRDLEAAETAQASREYIDPPDDFFDSIEGVEITPLPLPSRRIRTPKQRPPEDENYTPEMRRLDKQATRSTVDRESYLTISPSSDNIVFYYDGSCYSAEIDIKNQTSGYLAFKILSTSPHKYAVSPFKGIILANSIIRVSIVLRSHDLSGKKRSPSASELMPSFKDKFLCVATPITTANMPANEFNSLWNRSEENKVILSYKLRSRIGFTAASENECNEITAYDLVKQLDGRVRKMQRKQSQLQFWFYVLLIFTLLSWAVLFASIGSGHLSSENILQETFARSSDLAHRFTESIAQSTRGNDWLAITQDELTDAVARSSRKFHKKMTVSSFTCTQVFSQSSCDVIFYSTTLISLLFFVTFVVRFSIWFVALRIMHLGAYSQ